MLMPVPAAAPVQAAPMQISQPAVPAPIAAAAPYNGSVQFAAPPAPIMQPVAPAAPGPVPAPYQVPAVAPYQQPGVPVQAPVPVQPVQPVQAPPVQQAQPAQQIFQDAQGNQFTAVPVQPAAPAPAQPAAPAAPAQPVQAVQAAPMQMQPVAAQQLVTQQQVTQINPLADYVMGTLASTVAQTTNAARASGMHVADISHEDLGRVAQEAGFLASKGAMDPAYFGGDEFKKDVVALASVAYQRSGKDPTALQPQMPAPAPAQTYITPSGPVPAYTPGAPAPAFQASQVAVPTQVPVQQGPGVGVNPLMSPDQMLEHRAANTGHMIGT